MLKKVKINATIDPELLGRLDEYSLRSQEDRSTAIRQLLAFALREKNKTKALQAYKEGRLTIRQCAELLGVDYYEMNDLLSEANIPTIEDF
jgi:metal-responsive CopG/Arc/MetJ family transcriptional regulator